MMMRREGRPLRESGTPVAPLTVGERKHAELKRYQAMMKFLAEMTHDIATQTGRRAIVLALGGKSKPTEE
jgi:hypothetical protein